MTAEPMRHIVRQFNWLWAGKAIVRAPGERRIAWFDTEAEAVADWRGREQRVRERYNPFAFGTGWCHFTTLPPHVFRDWLMDDDITPPTGSTLDDWRNWWDAVKAEFRPDQFDRVWDGLNRLRFHDVIARRPTETAYCVCRLQWGFDDCWYHAGHEGGEPLKVFRTRERAEQERDRLEAELAANPRDRRTDWGHLPRDPELFLEYDVDSDTYYRAIRNPAPHFEVVEVDLPGGVP